MYGNGYSMAIVLDHRSTATSLTGNLWHNPRLPAIILSQIWICSSIFGEVQANKTESLIFVCRCSNGLWNHTLSFAIFLEKKKKKDTLSLAIFGEKHAVFIQKKHTSTLSFAFLGQNHIIDVGTPAVLHIIVSAPPPWAESMADGKCRTWQVGSKIVNTEH